MSELPSKKSPESADKRGKQPQRQMPERRSTEGQPSTEGTQRVVYSKEPARALEGRVLPSLESAVANQDHTTLEIGNGIHVDYFPEEGRFVLERDGSAGISHIELVQTEEGVQERVGDSDRVNTIGPDILHGLSGQAPREKDAWSRRERRQSSERVVRRDMPRREEAIAINADVVLAKSQGEKEPRMVDAIRDCLEHQDGSIVLKTKDSTAHLEASILAPLRDSGIHPSLLQDLTVIGERGGVQLKFDQYGEIHRIVDERMQMPEEKKSRVRDLIAEKYGQLMHFVSGLETMVAVNMQEGADEKEFRSAQRELNNELREIFDRKGPWARIRRTRTGTYVRHAATGRRLEKKRITRWLLGRDS